jgi:hypothetical protein
MFESHVKCPLTRYLFPDWPAIFLAVTLVFLFFFMEETNYQRRPAPSLSTTGSSPTGLTATLTDQEKSQPVISDSFQITPPKTSTKTFAQKLSLWHPTPNTTMSAHTKRSLQYLTWPVIFYCGFSYGSYLILFNILNATASIILGSPPYNFSASMVGLSYLSCVLGVVVGALTSGRVSDWLTIRLARRNGGVMEAEQRLWPFATCLVLVPGSLILWGVGAANHVHFFGLLVAMACLAYTSSMGVTLSVNYMIDSYHDISGDAIVSVILIRNTMSFAVNYGITPWLRNLGYQNCFLSAAFVGLAASSVFLFMVKYGKGLRVKSSEKYWSIVQADEDKM